MAKIITWCSCTRRSTRRSARRSIRWWRWHLWIIFSSIFCFRRSWSQHVFVHWQVTRNWWQVSKFPLIYICAKLSWFWRYFCQNSKIPPPNLTDSVGWDFFNQNWKLTLEKSLKITFQNTFFDFQTFDSSFLWFFGRKLNFELFLGLFSLRKSTKTNPGNFWGHVTIWLILIGQSVELSK